MEDWEYLSAYRNHEHMTLDEFKNAPNNPFVSAAEDASDKFKYLNLNGDGKLEFVEVYKTVRGEQIQREKFDEIWKKLDTNEDGVTSAAEALPGLEIIHSSLTLDEAKNKLEHYKPDDNGDVYRHIAENEHREAWIKAHREKANQEMSKAAFEEAWSVYDRNHDKKATYEEIRYIREILESEEATRKYFELYNQNQDMIVTLHEGFKS